MPGIGRPEAPNAFSNVQIGKPQAEDLSAPGVNFQEDDGTPQLKLTKNKETTGEALNRLSNNGKGDRVKFVDRKKHNQIGKDEFMKLLTVQLSNQDPSSPMDQKKLTSDMAQFAQLEQLTNMNSKFDGMTKNSNTEAKFYAVNFMGKEVTTSGTSINYDGESRAIDIPYTLPQGAKKVVMNLFDKQNAQIGRIEMLDVGKGTQMATWDGMAMDGARANKGEYRIEVRAFDQNFQPFLGETKSNGLVTGVGFDNGEMILTLNDGKKVFLRDVENFKLPGQNNVMNAKAGIKEYEQMAKH